MNYKIWLGVIELVLGIYLINSFFKWVKISTSFSVVNDWILVITGGLLILLSLISFFKRNSY